MVRPLNTAECYMVIAAKPRARTDSKLRRHDRHAMRISAHFKQRALVHRHACTPLYALLMLGRSVGRSFSDDDCDCGGNSSDSGGGVRTCGHAFINQRNSAPKCALLGMATRAHAWVQKL